MQVGKVLQDDLWQVAACLNKLLMLGPLFSSFINCLEKAKCNLLEPQIEENKLISVLQIQPDALAWMGSQSNTNSALYELRYAHGCFSSHHVPLCSPFAFLTRSITIIIFVLLQKAQDL
jgi:hypothetical protein